jgi:cytochrome b subunit of formate dehydrogenase
VSSDDGGYVHRPTDSESTTEAPESESEADSDGFGVRGWVLVAVLVVCLLIVPGVIYVRPGILSAVGIPYIASLLVLPLLPAVVLGLTAVWSMTAATDDE